MILKISVFAEVLPVIFYLIFYKRINDKNLRVIFLLLISNIISDFYGLYNVAHTSNNFVSFNINILIETTGLYVFLYNILLNGVVKKIVFSLILFFIIFWIYEFFQKGRSGFLDTCTTLENISFLALAIYFYYEQLIKSSSAFIYQEPRFWVICAYLVYIAGTFFLILYIPSLNRDDALKYYLLNYVFILIRTILLSVAMFMKHNNSPKQKFKLT